MCPAILLWHFYDAPSEYRALSEHGGDEDYLAFVPHGVDVPWWMDEEECSVFGVCSITKHQVDGGYVYIGAHA